MNHYSRILKRKLNEMTQELKQLVLEITAAFRKLIKLVAENEEAMVEENRPAIHFPNNPIDLIYLSPAFNTLSIIPSMALPSIQRATIMRSFSGST